MGCSSCSTSDGTPTGCGDKGHCASGGCNKMNTYDWLSTLDIDDPSAYQMVEVSFKNGARKDFFHNDWNIGAQTGDIVVVETSSGYDIGKVSLSGELVRIQMKKKCISEDRITSKVIRIANERDIEKLQEARNLEKESLVKARVIARTLGLDMKLGDVEYQGDKRKATFYYTADGRVDFRELVKEYAKEFRVKIEMRQIGARQESARIGGIGSCGRELCCSTWLSDFKSVNTTAARYQNIAINQSKLSGQCGRLKCCLNYELDTYMEALDDFPESAEKLKIKIGVATLVKTDIFKGLLYYVYDSDKLKSVFIPVPKSRVKDILEMNEKKQFPDDLLIAEHKTDSEEDIAHDFEDVTGLIELRPDKPNKRKNRKPNKNRNTQDNKTNGQNNRPIKSGIPSENQNSDQSPAAQKPRPQHKNQASQNQNKDNAPVSTNPNPPSSGHPTEDQKSNTRNKKYKNKKYKNKRKPGEGGTPPSNNPN